MNFGELDKFGTIKERVRIPDGKGGFREQGFLLIAEIWFSLRPLSGKENFELRQVRPGITHAVKTRYVLGVKPEMVLTFGDRLFEIVSVINFREESQELRLVCEELPVGATA